VKNNRKWADSKINESAFFYELYIDTRWYSWYNTLSRHGVSNLQIVKKKKTLTLDIVHDIFIESLTSGKENLFFEN